ncbi:MAG: aminopeptidase P family protein [Deltaproteobacteria bacterium]|nr:MAG: aminopeptidase P family protein [Deltaproteobacteria bacterium]
MSENIQGTGESFNLDAFLKARTLSKEAVRECAKRMQVGMSEAEGIELVESILKEKGMERTWHPTKFRIGKNTLKSFSEKSDENVRLGENDIFFMDIGPVFFGHEGDYGETFTTGNDALLEDAKNAAREVFWQTQSCWREEGINGKELYLQAQQIAKNHGYELNLKMDGHRLGDFPHGLFFKGSLADIEEVPIENLWVLEILIRHPEKEVGAFFEDIIR